MKTIVIELRCKHPLRDDAKFCHICGTSADAIRFVPGKAPVTKINLVAKANSSANYRDLQRIRAEADAISLDAEVWKLQKEFAQHRLVAPDPERHLGAMAGAIGAAITSTVLFEFAPSELRGWGVRLGMLMAVLGVVLFFRFVSLRRAFKISHAAWLSEYRQLGADLQEKWDWSSAKSTAAR